MSNEYIEYYYKELDRLSQEIIVRIEEKEKFIRRRNMASHSSFNSESFVNNLLEGEDTVLNALKLAERKKEIFDGFKIEDWMNNVIILEYDRKILDWCVEEFEYRPYTLGLGKSQYLYVFHNQEDAVATKLRWM